MNIWTVILIGLKEISSHKFRSFLTMLGIILGVASLVGMSALVQGMENGMREAMEAIGGIEKVSVIQQDLPPSQSHLSDQVVGITMDDVEALKQNATLTKLITPEMNLGRGSVVTRGNNMMRPFIISGTWPNALEMNSHVIEHGRMFNEIDDDLARNVCVIGTEVRDELFGERDASGKEIIPLGEQININGELFTIIGMFQRYESEKQKKQLLFILPDMAYTIKIDLKSQTPVYKQLISNVETAIHDGEYRYGDLLPSMNELSLQLGISKETVKKAYSLMRDKGIISATQGKGFYVSSENSGQKPKILVLFDKLSTYKQVLFSSFSSTIGTQGEITIRLHNQQVELLEYYIDENLDLFDYYVITPHFPLDEPTQRRAVKALTRIPNRKLILLDRYIESLPGNYGVAYQDFTNDVYDGLMQASKKLQKQNKLNIITEASSLYYSFIREGAERFCADHGIPCEFHQTVTPEIVRPQEVYLILNGQLDTELIDLARAAKEKKLKAGRDIGFISYNESPINEIVLNGLTTISTDFRQMGAVAARMILDKQLRKVKCDFRMTRRSTF